MIGKLVVVALVASATDLYAGPEHAIAETTRVAFTRRSADGKNWRFTPKKPYIDLKVGDRVIFTPLGKVPMIKARRSCRRKEGDVWGIGGEWIPSYPEVNDAYDKLGFKMTFVAGATTMGSLTLGLSGSQQNFVAPRHGRLVLDAPMYTKLDEQLKARVPPCNDPTEPVPNTDVEVFVDEAGVEDGILFSYVVCEAATTRTLECK